MCMCLCVCVCVNIYNIYIHIYNYITHCVAYREAVCTIFMVVFGMTRSGREPTTYRVRGGHANH